MADKSPISPNPGNPGGTSTKLGPGGLPNVPGVPSPGPDSTRVPNTPAPPKK